MGKSSVGITGHSGCPADPPWTPLDREWDQIPQQGPLLGMSCPVQRRSISGWPHLTRCMRFISVMGSQQGAVSGQANYWGFLLLRAFPGSVRNHWGPQAFASRKGGSAVRTIKDTLGAAIGGQDSCTSSEFRTIVLAVPGTDDSPARGGVGLPCRDLKPRCCGGPPAN